MLTKWSCLIRLGHTQSRSVFFIGKNANHLTKKLICVLWIWCGYMHLMRVPWAWFVSYGFDVCSTSLNCVLWAWYGFYGCDVSSVGLVIGCSDCNIIICTVKFSARRERTLTAACRELEWTARTSRRRKPVFSTMPRVRNREKRKEVEMLIGKWLLLSWHCGRFHNQRSAVQIQSSAKFYMDHVFTYC